MRAASRAVRGAISVDDRVLVLRMRTIAHGTQAVKGRNAVTGSEIAVRSAAYGHAFRSGQAEFSGQGSRRDRRAQPTAHVRTADG